MISNPNKFADIINLFICFFKDKNAVKHYPSEGEATLSGVIVEANEQTGLANNVSRVLIGGSLKI